MGYLLQQRAAALERKRKTAAEAIADALVWLELPYRIRRRLDDQPGTIAALSERIHDLQERLAFHDNWLRIELPRAHARYVALVHAVKDASMKAIQGAWQAPPLSAPGEMNIGSLGLASVEQQVSEFAEEVRRRLSWWRVWG